MAGYIGKSTSSRELLAILHAGLDHKVPVVMKGKPGIGKTSLIKALAVAKGYDLHILLGSTMDPTDLNGLPALSHWEYKGEDGVNTTIPVTTYALNQWAKELLTKKRVILLLDELNNAVPAVQSVLLSVVQDRKIGDVTLPDEVWIIAAMNAAEDAADGWVLSPPMANRFLHVDYELDVDDWVEGMLQNWGDEAPVHGTPDFDRNFDRYQKLSTQRAEIAGFVGQHPELLINMPDNRDDAGEAWPSPRSWDNAARILSSIPKSPQTMGIRFRALKGLVSEPVAISYRTYEEQLRLPAYESVLNNPSRVNWEDLTTAQVKLTLDMVLNRMSRDNLIPSLDVFQYYAENSPRKEVVASLLGPIGEAIHGKGVDRRQEMTLYQQKIVIPTQKVLREASITLR